MLTFWADSCIYIWRTQTGQQVEALEHHTTGTVNCVAWSPTNYAVFASAGDDHKVRMYVYHPRLSTTCRVSTDHISTDGPTPMHFVRNLHKWDLDGSWGMTVSQDDDAPGCLAPLLLYAHGLHLIMKSDGV